MYVYICSIISIIILRMGLVVGRRYSPQRRQGGLAFLKCQGRARRGMHEVCCNLVEYKDVPDLSDIFVATTH